MTLDAHVTGIWCGQIGGGVGRFSMARFYGTSNRRQDDVGKSL